MNRSEEWPATRRALGYALASAALSLYVLAAFRLGKPLGNTDFDQTWWAGRALLAGTDAYAAVAAQVPEPFEFPYYYPGPTILVGALFAGLDLWGARVAFALLSGAVFGYAIGKHRPHLWPVFAGLPFILTAQNLQWSGLLTAAVLIPAFGFLAAAKPNLGAMALFGQSTRRGASWVIGGSLALVALSLLLDPQWPMKWRDALAHSTHFKPILFRPFGWLMLVGLWKWRIPEARLLVALAVVPQTGLGYDALPAWLAARTRMQAGILALLSQVTWFAGKLHSPVEGFTEMTWVNGQFVLWSTLLPALGFVFWRGRRTLPEKRDSLSQIPLANSAQR